MHCVINDSKLNEGLSCNLNWNKCKGRNINLQQMPQIRILKKEEVDDFKNVFKRYFSTIERQTIFWYFFV